MHQLSCPRLIGVLCVLLCWHSAFAEPAVNADGTNADGTATNLPTYLKLGIAGAGYDVSGNFRRAQQYVIPANGGLLLHYLANDGKAMLDVNLHDIGAVAGGGDLWLYNSQGGLLITGQQRRSEFYRDWSADGERLSRRDSALGLSAPVGNGELQISDTTNALSGQFNTNPEDWTREMTQVSLVNRSNGWLSRVGVGNEQFNFFTGGPEFSGQEKSASLSLTSPGADRTTVEANANFSQTSLSTDQVNKTPTASSFAVTGTQLIGNSASLIGQLTHDQLTDSITENAYAQRDTGARLEMDFHGIPHSDLDLGGGANLVHYLNAPQTTSYDTTENQLFAKFTSRLAKQLTLKASDTAWWTNNRPAAFDLITSVTTGSLVWSSKQDQNVELSYNPTMNTGLVAQWHRLGWTNVDFAAENAIVSRSLYGWWMPHEAVTLYASYLKQQFNLTATPDSALYLTDADHDVVVGASFQLTPRLLLDSSFTFASEAGAQGADQQITALGLSYRWPSGTALSVRAVLDNFSPSATATALGYESHWYELRLSKLLF